MPSDIAAKGSCLPDWFIQSRKSGTECKSKGVYDKDLDDHGVDWSRVGIDNGDPWKFPPAPHENLRFLAREIVKYLPSSHPLILTWITTTNLSGIPDYTTFLSPTPESPLLDDTLVWDLRAPTIIQIAHWTQPPWTSVRTPQLSSIVTGMNSRHFQFSIISVTCSWTSDIFATPHSRP